MKTITKKTKEKVERCLKENKGVFSVARGEIYYPPVFGASITLRVK